MRRFLVSPLPAVPRRRVFLSSAKLFQGRAQRWSAGVQVSLEPKYLAYCDRALEMIQEEHRGVLRQRTNEDETSVLRTTADAWNRRRAESEPMIRKHVPAEAPTDIEQQHSYTRVKEAHEDTSTQGRGSFAGSVSNDSAPMPFEPE